MAAMTATMASPLALNTAVHAPTNFINVKHGSITKISPETSPMNPSTSPPEALVDLALQQLSAAGVKLIEWRAMLYRRMSVPMIPKNFSYIVDDSSMSLASTTLSSLGLPLSTPDPFLVDTEGDFYAKAVLHRLTSSSDPGSVRYIALYPSSYTSFSPSDLQTVSSCTHERFTNIKVAPIEIFVPRPPAVYTTLLRLIAQYPRGSPTRSALQSDLSLIIMYHLYGMDGSPTADDEGSEEEDEDVLKAVALVRQWSIEEQWREGEEWMGDALGAIVAGTGDIVWLP